MFQKEKVMFNNDTYEEFYKINFGEPDNVSKKTLKTIFQEVIEKWEVYKDNFAPIPATMTAAYGNVLKHYASGRNAC